MTFTYTYTIKLVSAFFARSKVLLAIAGVLLVALLIACAPEDKDAGGGGDDTYTVGGSISGHTAPVSLTLTYGEDNKTETLEIPTGTETFTFAAKLTANQSFAIEVTPPNGQTCRSSLTGGTIENADVTNILISCENISQRFDLSGNVSGASASRNLTISLFLSDEDDIDTSTDNANTTTTVNADGGFSFEVAENKYYQITVETSTANETCQIAMGEKGQVTAELPDISITCTGGGDIVLYDIQGIVRIDVTLRATVTIKLFLADTAIIDISGQPDDETATDFDGVYIFSNIPENKFYKITVTSTTAGLFCSPANESGLLTRNIDGLDVYCTDTYQVSGSVTGSTDNSKVSIDVYWGDSPDFTLSEDKKYTSAVDGSGAFSVADVPENLHTTAGDTIQQYYKVSASSSNPGETCATSDAGGQITSDITGIIFTCTRAFSVSGTLNGAIANSNVTINLFLGDTAINDTTVAPDESISPNNDDGAFSFADIPENKYYQDDRHFDHY